MLKFSVLVIVICFVEIILGLERTKRGASVYPVFGGSGSSSSHGAEQNSYLFRFDASPFIQHLGGSGGSQNSHGGNAGSQYSNLQASPRSGYDGSSGGPLDNNLLNSYMSSSFSRPGGYSSPSTSTGWQPAGGYAGSYHTAYFGSVTPNFANSGSGGASSPRTQRHSLPNLDAHVLLQAATSSQNSQNHLFNVLNSGNPPHQSYKGGL